MEQKEDERTRTRIRGDEEEMRRGDERSRKRWDKDDAMRMSNGENSGTNDDEGRERHTKNEDNGDMAEKDDEEAGVNVREQRQ